MMVPGSCVRMFLSGYKTTATPKVRPDSHGNKEPGSKMNLEPGYRIFCRDAPVSTV
jgi:hypothetical protein